MYNKNYSLLHVTFKLPIVVHLLNVIPIPILTFPHYNHHACKLTHNYRRKNKIFKTELSFAFLQLQHLHGYVGAM